MQPLVRQILFAALETYVIIPACFLLELASTIFRYVNRTSFVDTERKAVMITGCDTGFGRRAAELFSISGVKVFAGCLNEKCADELESYSGKCDITAFVHDVTSQESSEQAVQLVRKACAAEGYVLWGLIPNAGVGDAVRPADWFTMDDYEKILDINLMGAIRTVTLFLPLIKQSKGRIVIVSSILGYSACRGAVAYNTSKFAMRGFAESLRYDLANKGVHVAVMAPCGFRTKVHDVMTDTLSAWNKLPKELQAEYPYGTEVERQKKINEFREKTLLRNEVDDVVDAYYHAIFAQWPQFTYFLGRQAPLILLLNQFPDYIKAKVGGDDKMTHQLLQWS